MSTVRASKCENQGSNAECGSRVHLLIPVLHHFSHWDPWVHSEEGTVPWICVCVCVHAHRHKHTGMHVCTCFLIMHVFLELLMSSDFLWSIFKQLFYQVLVKNENSLILRTITQKSSFWQIKTFNKVSNKFQFPYY